MSFVQALRRQARLHAFWAPRRCLASQSTPAAAPAAALDSTGASPKAGSAPKALSSCPENMVMQGLNYLKGQPEVVAQADDAYPPWLWTILDKKELPDDGPGGLAEKKRLRKANRQRIRDQNFMKTQ
ncbi:mitochondrial/chloroplast ribosomal protein L54/L37 [Dichomitus squalens]|uniref:Large ribosomal subunit protein mL54 n=1 Tax=Dichomitus squalens TaxID=114155 RepID=A0A4Q9N919_9APHY|nr:mitochondrial/chloroplast ribosomal protein L54/L37 [Dichomitus squalens]